MTIEPDVVRQHIRDIPDWPQPGVTFRDITPLIRDADIFAATIDGLVEPFRDRRIDRVLGVEARGFVFAAPAAYILGAGFVPVRKPGKLPWTIEQEEYALEYGTDQLEVHVDGIHPGESVLIIDDVLATGGTAAASARLVERLGGTVVALSFVLEILPLGGRGQLDGHDIVSLATYD